jgi:hypothetical protein
LFLKFGDQARPMFGAKLLRSVLWYWPGLPALVPRVVYLPCGLRMAWSESVPSGMSGSMPTLLAMRRAGNSS